MLAAPYIALFSGQPPTRAHLKALETFLTATLSPVSSSRAATTTPYAPVPICLSGVYRASMFTRAQSAAWQQEREGRDQEGPGRGASGRQPGCVNRAHAHTNFLTDPCIPSEHAQPDRSRRSGAPARRMGRDLSFVLGRLAGGGGLIARAPAGGFLAAIALVLAGPVDRAAAFAYGREVNRAPPRARCFRAVAYLCGWRAPRGRVARGRQWRRAGGSANARSAANRHRYHLGRRKAQRIPRERASGRRRRRGRQRWRGHPWRRRGGGGQAGQRRGAHRAVMPCAGAVMISTLGGA